MKMKLAIGRSPRLYIYVYIYCLIIYSKSAKIAAAATAAKSIKINEDKYQKYTLPTSPRSLPCQ